LRFAADFVDIFEVRGTHRARRGTLLPPAVEEGELVLRYAGLDHVARATRIAFHPAPERLAPGHADFDVTLVPREHWTILCTVACEGSAAPPARLSETDGLAALHAHLAAGGAEHCQIESSDALFNDWVRRSMADLHMMITGTPHGPYPYAGVPWYNTAFGRDGIVTAFQLLWIYPSLARGVLAYLAATQAAEAAPERDAEPGKILHETRGGEMAALGEIPFARYYGTVDATPLFVALAGAYYDRTGDLEFIASIWTSLERALTWIETCGDRDGDLFVEYARRTPEGLAQQGWKDSHDSVFHADGRPAPAPIALCEVQGYVYDAWQQAAKLSRLLGHADRARRLDERAAALRESFERRYWDEEIGTYVLALDGEKRPCQVRTSNAGHCLFSGIASEGRAARTADTLFEDDMYSGWGIRTLSAREARYNPMSYHNGSIWPHDNSLIASGFGRYGLTARAARLLEDFYAASLFMDLHRLPELFCGFRRRQAEGPTLYPVACAPQSWAAGAVFLLLQACFGLSIDAAGRRVSFRRSSLPSFLKWVRITNLRVGDGSVDLALEQHPLDVGLRILATTGDIEIVAVKG
jgi:glycogen debranching enzyme